MQKLLCFCLELKRLNRCSHHLYSLPDKTRYRFSITPALHAPGRSRRKAIHGEQINASSFPRLRRYVSLALSSTSFALIHNRAEGAICKAAGCVLRMGVTGTASEAPTSTAIDLVIISIEITRRRRFLIFTSNPQSPASGPSMILIFCPTER